MQPDRDRATPSIMLKAFLKGKRERLRPEAVGLPSRRSTRCTGLRREDIAELLGVSPLWYSLFESGTSRRRFSASFLRRVQDALQLSASDYETLLALAVASRCATPELEVEWYSARWDLLVAYVSDVAQRIENAAPESAAELARASLHSVLEKLSPVVAY